jgi:23S rRNA (pseudouridine1915-N3)-methyltransferase
VRLRIVATGKLRSDPLREVVDDYVARLSRYLPTEEVEVPAGGHDRALRALSRALPDRWEVWALDPAGLQPTSAELAAWLERRLGQGTPGVAFVVGGAEGLPERLVSRADVRLSLSRLTLPHRLARVVLAEQLYRAMTIIRGEPYDK